MATDKRNHKRKWKKYQTKWCPMSPSRSRSPERESRRPLPVWLEGYDFNKRPSDSGISATEVAGIAVGMGVL